MTPALEQIKALPAPAMRACVVKRNGYEDIIAELTGDGPAVFRDDGLYTEEQVRELLAKERAALQALRDEAGEAVAWQSPFGSCVCDGDNACPGCNPNEAIALARQIASDEERLKHPPCVECGATSLDDAQGKCRCGGDKDDCHGCQLWPDDRPAPAAEAAPQGGVEAIMRKVVDGVMAQREEVLRAFVAKYGFQPDEAVQVVGADGSWRVIRREEMYATPPSAPAVLPDVMTDAEVRQWIDACNYGKARDTLRHYLAIRRLSAPVPQEGVDEERAIDRMIRQYLQDEPGEAENGVAVDCERTREFYRRLLRAALAAGALPQGMVLVPRALAEMAVTVASEWLDLFADTPGLEKYDRFTYGPQVELLRDDLTAALSAAPAQGVR